MSSVFISGVMSILVNCRNRSNHCFGVIIAFPSEALASRFGIGFVADMFLI